MSKQMAFVEIVRRSDDFVGFRMGPMSKSRADKVEMGAMRNMDTENWYTRQVSEPTNE